MDVDERTLGELREHWRRFAREDPLGYARYGSRTDDRRTFYESGRRDVAGILSFVGDVPRRSALDLGCGPGRLLAGLAAEFERVDAVDISPEMIEVARSSNPPPNVHLHVTSGADLRPIADESVDLAVSLLVLQHIPDGALVARYLGEIRRVLTPEGRAFLQFDSRPPSVAERLGHAIPDRLLPPIRRRYARRYRRRPDDIDEMLHRTDLGVVRESGRGQANHHIVVARG